MSEDRDPADDYADDDGFYDLLLPVATMMVAIAFCIWLLVTL